MARPFFLAVDHCANLDLRVPSLGEAKQLAQTHDIPNVDETEFFWTDEYYLGSDGSTAFAWTVSDNCNRDATGINASEETVCVMTPTN